MDIGKSQTDPVQMQQYWYEKLGDRDWDSYSLDDHEVLKRNIGYALFGSPQVLPSTLSLPNSCNTIQSSAVADNQLGYSQDQEKDITTIYDLIKKNHFIVDSGKIIMRVIFIVCKIKLDKNDKNKTHKRDLFQVPIFVIKKCNPNGDFENTTSTCKLFIDNEGRVYKSWQLFLSENKLPRCVMYCPLNGQYSGQIVTANSDMTDGEVIVKLEVNESPACAISKKILNHTDNAGTVVSVGSTVAILASIIPGVVVAPAILTAAAVGGIAVGTYAFGRSVKTLVDRSKHQQSIGLKNSEARNCWLNASTSVLMAGSSAAAGLLTRAVGNGTRIGQGARAAFNVLQAGALIGSATAMVNSGYMLYIKLKNKEEITALEIFQFSSSVLFLCRSTISYRTASAIILDTQASTLRAYENELRSNRHRKIFRKAVLEGKRLVGQENAQADIISGIKKIDNKDNFFAGLAKRNKEFNKNNVKYTITSGGYIKLNNALIIDPSEFASIRSVDRAAILSSLPPAQPVIPLEAFDRTKVTINKWFDQSLNSQTKIKMGQAVMKALSTIINSGFDSESIALVLSDVAQDAVDYIMSVFTEFYCSLDTMVLKKLKQLFPLVDSQMAILQFVKSILIEMISALGLPIDKYFKLILNSDGSVQLTFIEILKHKLDIWLKNLSPTNVQVLTDSFVNGRKKRKDCSHCNGHYYITISDN